MSERVIHGKPGSGKSCFCVSLLIQALTDWTRYDIEKGELYNRVLYTNIPLDIEAVTEYLQKEVGGEFDVSQHIELIEDSFFKDSNGDYREWWDDFPEGAYIVIDEVHHYLPSNLKSDKQGRELSKSFVNYVSTHRHKQQDIIFLTQHLNNIAPEVKRMAEVVYEVLNIKNTTVGIWPFKVAMQDIDVVREAWGYPVQLAHIKRGVCEANSVSYDKGKEIFVLTSQLFKLYRSHTMSNESSNRPTLKLGKVGSVIWLVRRYFHKFAIWLVVLISFIFGAKNFIEQIPTMMTNAIKPPNFQLPNGVKQPSSPPAVNPQVPATVSEPVPASLSAAEHVSERASARTDDVIMGFVKGGVITQRGVIRQEEHLTVDGEKDYVKNVDVFRGILYLGSGKKIQK